MDGVVTTPRLRLRSQVWNFGRHFFEMCVAMCLGVALTELLLAGAAAVGYPDLRQQLPHVSLLVIAAVITLPMAAWMRFRGMEWRPILEMAAAGIGVVIIFAALGIISPSAVAVGSVCSLECAVMFVAMLVRLDLYTGHSGHHMGHVEHA